MGVKVGANLQWYVQRDGKASGPYSAEDLRDQVRQGLLLGHDLVFQEGSEQWKRAFDWPDLASEIFSEERTSFTRLFNLPRAGSAPPEDWIVLLRFEEADGLRFKQKGPFSTEQVRELLQSGQMKPSDHLWRKGYAAWVAVYLEPDFSPSLWNVKNDSIPLLRAVAETVVPPRLPEAVVPPEMPKGPGELEDQDLSDAVTASGSTHQESSFDLPPPAPKRKKWAYAVPVTLALVLGVGYYKKDTFLPAGARLWILNPAGAPGVEDVLSGEDESTSQVNPPAANLPAPVAAAPTPTPAPVQAKPKEPAMVRQDPVTWSFSLPAVSKNPLVVMITGYSGRILQEQALNLRFNLEAPANARLELSPAAHNLPEGEYLIQIFQDGKLIARGQRSTIENPEKFASKILLHRKQIAFDQQQEKRTLLKSVVRLQNFVTKYRAELAGKSTSAKVKKTIQKDFAAIARAEMKIVRQSRHTLMYPSGWSSVGQQYESVRGVVAGVGSRRPASKVEIENYRKKLTQLRSQVSQMSLSGN
ncbi:MAG: DUF4339 domain-containing protein [Bdellovibrio sp.]|jgi:hypothetical protein